MNVVLTALIESFAQGASLALTVYLLVKEKKEKEEMGGLDVKT